MEERCVVLILAYFRHLELLSLGMDDQQQFCLRWNDFQTNMVASFKHLRDEKSFTDVTIACDGQSTKAHKMILSACSPYFKALLEENPAKHPIIILKDVPFQHLTAILEFMYAGEVNVAQDQLPQFLKTAERLKVSLGQCDSLLLASLYQLLGLRLSPFFPTVSWLTADCLL